MTKGNDSPISFMNIDEKNPKQNNRKLSLETLGKKEKDHGSYGANKIETQREGLPLVEIKKC